MQIDKLEQLEKYTFCLASAMLLLNDESLDSLQQLRAEKNLTMLKVNSINDGKK